MESQQKLAPKKVGFVYFLPFLLLFFFSSSFSWHTTLFLFKMIDMVIGFKQQMRATFFLRVREGFETQKISIKYIKNRNPWRVHDGRSFEIMTCFARQMTSSNCVEDVKEKINVFLIRIINMQTPSLRQQQKHNFKSVANSMLLHICIKVTWNDCRHFFGMNPGIHCKYLSSKTESVSRPN